MCPWPTAPVLLLLLVLVVILTQLEEGGRGLGIVVDLGDLCVVRRPDTSLMASLRSLGWEGKEIIGHTVR